LPNEFGGGFFVKKIVLTGGGTLGHVTPHLALIPHLKKAGYENYEVIWTVTGEENDSIRAIKKEAEEGFLQADRVFSCQNHNAFLDMMDGVVSGKTGFTAKAGYCYVGALEKDGKRFTIALLACGWPNNKTWKWHDSRILLEYGLKHYEKQDLFCKTDLKELPVNQGQTAYVMTKVNEKKIERLVADHDRVEVILEMPERLQAPVSAGEKVGEQRYYINGELIETLSVVSVQKSLKIDYVFWVKKIVNLILL